MQPLLPELNAELLWESLERYRNTGNKTPRIWKIFINKTKHSYDNKTEVLKYDLKAACDT